MIFLKTKELPIGTLRNFFTTYWGSPKMVISSGVYDCSKLDGIAALDEMEEIIGLITFIIKEQRCEIISLDSIREGKGVGTALIEKAEAAAKAAGCSCIKLITTNDNLNALRFYQKRGYRLSALHLDAVQKARKIKPQIPLIGYDGIPIRDEIELEKLLE
ncbi:GNAT family N-acetyltransferase [Bacillus sp. ISL-47]|uniref:GNAT family N-acetyltransferase n=1 Tax=Bacillus sp. ISL-47 TaxID=2819130 RepID=UPI001BEC3E99|nr:GNAT family N-acetyltransferase [Bacillus sp. ISL-47]MBT2690217.1 GNAT family N-acetyltransferase [Bacillus sp. ISL-47]MBT2710334.1 GNAT family N-acetyltransferase [Pseudomonas sp. ISL-84]